MVWCFVLGAKRQCEEFECAARTSEIRVHLVALGVLGVLDGLICSSWRLCVKFLLRVTQLLKWVPVLASHLVWVPLSAKRHEERRIAHMTSLFCTGDVCMR